MQGVSSHFVKKKRKKKGGPDFLLLLYTDTSLILQTTKEPWTSEKKQLMVCCGLRSSRMYTHIYAPHARACVHTHTHTHTHTHMLTPHTLKCSVCRMLVEEQTRSVLQHSPPKMKPGSAYRLHMLKRTPLASCLVSTLSTTRGNWQTSFKSPANLRTVLLNT